MKLYNISLQSIKRRKTRTAFLIIGLILAVASFVTLYVVSENVNRSVASNLDEFGANMIITPKTNDLDLVYGGLNVAGLTFNKAELNQNDIEKIRSIKNRDNLSIIAPILFGTVTILSNDKAGLRNASTDGKKVVAAGIDFKEEIRLKKWWSIKGTAPAELNDALAGSKAAKILNLKLNKRVNINGEDFIVKGILNETGSQDDGLIFIDLTKAQKLFNKSSLTAKRNSLSLIEIAARCYDCPIEEITRQISAKLPGANVTAIKQSIESKMTAVHRFEHFSYGVSAVILVISLLIVFSNVSASVNERTKEIGIFMAVGFRRLQIIKIILLEVLIASFAAGIIGFILGIGASKIITPVLAMEENIKINFSFLLLFFSAGVAVLVGLLAGIHPAIRASRLDPTTAFRSL